MVHVNRAWTGFKFQFYHLDKLLNLSVSKLSYMENGIMTLPTGCCQGWMNESIFACHGSEHLRNASSYSFFIEV